MHQTSKLSVLVAVILTTTSMPLAVRAESGGIRLEQTRIVITEGDKLPSVSIRNNSERTWLVRNRVQLSVDNTTQAPFAVAPPLFALKANSRQLLRIIPWATAVRSDRESLFRLVVSAAPAQQKGIDDSQLSVGVRFIVKLIWRPAGAGTPPARAACQLVFRHEPQGLRVFNPTPWYQTLSSLSVDGYPALIEQRVTDIPPQESHLLPYKQKAGQVNWQGITDDGDVSPACEQQLAVTRTTQ